jgi:hypothetical protein
MASHNQAFMNSISFLDAIGLLQSAMKTPKRSVAPEKTFQIEITESELVLLSTALLRLEHWQVLIAKSEQLKGLDRQSCARRQTSSKCLALVDRLENIGAEQGARE